MDEALIKQRLNKALGRPNSDLSTEQLLSRVEGRLAAADAIVQAWVRPGPAPRLHRREQDNLRERWPTLFQAVIDLVKR